MMKELEKHAVVLAAGKGTRMATDEPKCAVKVLGKPMIMHVVETLEACGIEDIVVVVGYKKEVIIDLLKDDNNVTFVQQENQLGTADACNSAKPVLNFKQGLTVILPGDMPLFGKDNVNNLLEYHVKENNKMTILSCHFDDPTSYGRIIRNEENNVIGIVEEKEATSEQKLIKEVNSGLYVVDNDLLFKALEKVDNNNNKGEYYLTDIVKILSKDYKVGALEVPYDYHLIGINDVPTLELVEKLALEK